MSLTNLIEALTILRKYGDPMCPTHCEHDIMVINGIDPADVSEADKSALETLHFANGECDASGGEACFYSYYYGSA